MRYLSCAPSRLYRAGGFYEGEALLQELKAGEPHQDSIRVLDEIFPPFSYVRRAPATLSVGSASFAQSVMQLYRDINDRNSHGAASALVEIKDAALANNVLYSRYPGANSIIYESYRPNERPYTSLVDNVDAEASDQVIDVRSHDEAFLFLGSVGSFNYGHWLVDDLVRLKAIDVLRHVCGDRKITILVPSYSAAMDNVCIDSIRQLLPEGDGYSIRLIEASYLYRFDQLYYATPVSYHPVLKSPDALQHLARTVLKLHDGLMRARGTDRVFVVRREERGRALTNLESIRLLVESYGFKIVDPESLPYGEQVSTFSAAGLVAGSMGAAMTNTIFCAPGTDVVYLAPEGWVEPFYWDMAEVLGHNYHVCYGPIVDTGAPPHKSDFSIPENRLRSILDRIISPQH